MDRFGIEKTYILSAAWSLIKADFLTPCERRMRISQKISNLPTRVNVYFQSTRPKASPTTANQPSPCTCIIGFEACSQRSLVLQPTDSPSRPKLHQTP